MKTNNQWVLEEIEQRGWSQADLARRCKSPNATISHILDGSRNIGFDMANSLSHAFKMPLETVYRKSGLLPNIGMIDPEEEKIKYILSQMSPIDKERALSLIDTVLSFRGDKKNDDRERLRDNSEMAPPKPA
jgi:transcriptional regulator with XRE-family HTH domain